MNLLANRFHSAPTALGRRRGDYWDARFFCRVNICSSTMTLLARVWKSTTEGDSWIYSVRLTKQKGNDWKQPIMGKPSGWDNAWGRYMNCRNFSFGSFRWGNRSYEHSLCGTDDGLISIHTKTLENGLV